jgi:hypothetical protein
MPPELHLGTIGESSSGIERPGTVRVGLHMLRDDVLLSVEDNGVGLPTERRVGSMGMRLIEGLARGLEGALTIKGNAPCPAPCFIVLRSCMPRTCGVGHRSP